jgi:hypothetical protein
MVSQDSSQGKQDDRYFCILEGLCGFGIFFDQKGQNIGSAELSKLLVQALVR